MTQKNYRVLIVEDEPLERKAQEHILSKSGYPVEIRTAGNVPDFERMAMSWLPDIVFVDIRIPGGDGLSSLANLRAKGFEGEAVVVTAFDVFQYAQKAVGLGVRKFLVKPVAPGKLEETLEEIVSVVERKRSEANRFQTIQGFLQKNRGALALSLLNQLVMEKEADDSIAPELKELGLPPGRTCHLFGLICIQDEEEKKNGPLFLWDAVERELPANSVVVPWRRQCALLFIPSAKGSFEEEEMFSSQLLGLISSMHFAANAAYGGKISKLDEIAPAITQMEDTLEESLLGGTGRLVVWEEKAEDPKKPDAELTDLGYESARAQVVEGFSNGQPELLSRANRKIEEIIEKIGPVDAEMTKVLLLGLFGQICNVLLTLKCDIQDVKSWSRRQLLSLLAPNNPMGLKKIVSQAIDQAWHVRNSATDSGFMIIQQSLLYIQENYMDVTLESVSEAVHVSPAYLSRLFRRVLKRRFVDEVKTVRIEKAKTLLAQGISVRDVAISVGYGNIAYFSTLFKQCTGMSPSEYRGYSMK
jgi:two-component system response regulator YesN